MAAAPRPHAQPHEEHHPHGGDWLRELVFGLNDGLVTTLVFLMTVSAVTAGASLRLIAVGEIVAGGISMALGGYLSARTEGEIRGQRIETERHEIQHEPAEERAELQRIYRHKGLHGPLLERVVDHLTQDEDRWLHAMVHDEHGIIEDHGLPEWVRGLLIGGSFVLGGVIPALPILLSWPRPRVIAYVLTALTALALGAVKSRYTLKGPIRAALEFLVIVTAGTLAGIGIGFVLHAV